MLSRLIAVLRLVCLLAACASFLSAQVLTVNKYAFSGDPTPIGMTGNSPLSLAETCINSSYTNVASCWATYGLTTGETNIAAPVLYVITISNGDPTQANNAYVYETFPSNFVIDTPGPPNVDCHYFGAACGSPQTILPKPAKALPLGPYTIPENGYIVLYIIGHFDLTIAPPFTETNFVSAVPTDTLAQCQSDLNAGLRYNCGFAPLQVLGYSLLTDLGITKIVCIPSGSSCPPAPNNTAQPTATTTGAAPVTFIVTITNNGPALMYTDVLQVADQISNNGSFTVNLTSTLPICSPSAYTCTSAVQSGLMPPGSQTAGVLATGFPSAPLPVGQSITITYTVTFSYLACVAGSVENIAYFGYSNGVVTFSDTNPLNNTSNDPPSSFPAIVTLPANTTNCPPVLGLKKTVTPASSPGSGSQPWSTTWDYTITLTSTGPIPASTLTDYLSKSVPTPYFTTGSITVKSCTGCTGGIAGLKPLALTVSTNNWYVQFQVPIDAITSPTGGTVTIEYTVQYTPQCETNAGQDQITNEADWNVSGIDYTGLAFAFLVENTTCQLSACKVNYDATMGGTVPYPSPSVCTNPPQYPALLFPGAATFTIFYQNLASSQQTVGTVRDALSVSSQTYGQFPIGYSSSCTFLPPNVGTLVKPGALSSPLGPVVVWNTPQWAGLDPINIENQIFPPNSTLMCKLTVSTGSAPADLPTLCQGTGVPQLTNSALMDLSTGIDYNNSSNTPPGAAFGQASLILPLCQNVTVVKQGTTSVGDGQPASFTITASNNESNAVNNFSVSDPLPPGFSSPGALACSPTPCTVTTTVVKGVTYVNVTFTTIPQGASGTLSFTATAPSAGGPFNNTATGSFQAPSANCVPPSCDPYAYSGGGDLVGVLNGQVLAPKLAKAFSTALGPAGALYILTFTITNTNENPAQSGMGFTDTLPPGLYFSNAVPSPGCGGTAVYSGGPPPNTMTFTGGVLSAGSSGCTFTVQVAATSASCGSYTNSQSNITNVTNLDATSIVPTTLQVACGTGQVKICKIDGGGVSGKSFTFSAAVAGALQSYTVQAGPAAQGGNCVDAGTFPVGTSVTVTEGALNSYTGVSAINVSPPSQGTSCTNAPCPSSVVVRAGTGPTVVTFTNRSHFHFIPSPPFTGTLLVPQLLDLTSDQPTTFTAVANITSGPAGWLNVSPSQGTTPATLTVSAVPLPAGNYAGFITVTSADQTISDIIPVTYNAETVVPPTPVLASPADGNTSNSAYTFVYTDPRGFQDMNVANILVNNFLDGRQACYLAYVVSSSTLVLVDDGGHPAGPYAGSVVLGSSATIQNSQCAVTLVSANGSGNNLTLVLTIAWTPAFAGDKIVHMAVGDVAGNNSGWQRLGVWRVPGGTPTTATAVVGMSPDSGAGLGPNQFTFNWSDTKGFADLGVENILVNDFLDGRHACYLAFARPGNVMYLVNDNGDGLLPGQSLGASGSLSNSQCTVSWGSAPVNAAGNTLALTLNMAFTAAFGGHRVMYLAARDVNEADNTDWHAMGAWSVQPALSVFLQSRPSGSANLSMGVTNSGVATATNVTVTSIAEITATGSTFVYNPGALVVPFVIPGAASLNPGATSGFNLDFTATSGSAAAPFSFVITLQADNVPAFSTTINLQQAGVTDTVTTNPAGLNVSIDTATPVAAPQTVNWISGSTHALTAPSPQLDTAGDTQYTLSTAQPWTASTGANITSTGSVASAPAASSTFTANFNTAYQVTLVLNGCVTGQTNPAGLAPGNPVFAAANSTVQVIISAAASLPNVFQNFVVNPSTNATIGSGVVTINPLTGPVTITANCTAVQNVTLTVATSPSGLQARIGTSGSYAAAPIAQQVPANQTQTIGVTDPQFVAAYGTGYSFTGWSTGGSTAITTVQPASNFTATANFNAVCYQLTLNVLPANSGSVAPSPASGGLTGLPANCYAPGTVVTLTAAGVNGNVLQSWTGASGTGNTATVTVNAPLTVTANFTQPVTDTVTTSPPNLKVVIDSGSQVTAPQTVNWVSGSVHSLTAPSPQLNGAGDTQYTLSTGTPWTATVGAITSAGSVASAPAASSTFTANFNTAYKVTLVLNGCVTGQTNPAGLAPGNPVFAAANSTVQVIISAAAILPNVFQNFVVNPSTNATIGSGVVTINPLTGPVTITANCAPPPHVVFALTSRTDGNLSMDVSNTGTTTATNVTIDSITNITPSTIVYDPAFFSLPVLVPGGSSVPTGGHGGFNLLFEVSGSTGFTTSFSFLITAHADNEAQFTQTITVP